MTHPIDKGKVKRLLRRLQLEFRRWYDGGLRHREWNELFELRGDRFRL